jgi:divalent metal cation (Fe/Co/Zn/Cd) transporter
VLLDVVSSIVLIWRFRRAEEIERAERIAHRVACIALGSFGVLLAVQAVRNLLSDAHADESVAAIGLAGAGLLVLPLLARWKYRAARAVASPALRADAHITSVSAAMAGVTLVGLVVDADAIAALVIAGVAMWQGYSGISKT